MFSFKALILHALKKIKLACKLQEKLHHLTHPLRIKNFVTSIDMAFFRENKIQIVLFQNQ